MKQIVIPISGWRENMFATPRAPFLPALRLSRNDATQKKMKPQIDADGRRPEVSIGVSLGSRQLLIRPLNNMSRHDFRLTHFLSGFPGPVPNSPLAYARSYGRSQYLVATSVSEWRQDQPRQLFHLAPRSHRSLTLAATAKSNTCNYAISNSQNSISNGAPFLSPPSSRACRGISCGRDNPRHSHCCHT